MPEYEQKLRHFMPFGGDAPIVRLRIGDVFFAPAPHRLTTLLGSCVAVCLWDWKRHKGGMLHALVPSRKKGTPIGDVFLGADDAIDELLRRMLADGCRTGTINAKLFGGCSPMQTPGGGLMIGQANIASATATLERHGIAVVAQEVFGAGGMMVYQNTETGEVNVRRFAPMAEPEVD